MDNEKYKSIKGYVLLINKLIFLFVFIFFLTKNLFSEVLPNTRLQCTGKVYCDEGSCISSKINLEDITFFVDIENFANTYNLITVEDIPFLIHNEKLQVEEDFLLFLADHNTIGELSGQINRYKGTIYISEVKHIVDDTATLSKMIHADCIKVDLKQKLL